MSRKRKQHSAALKARVALSAARELESISALSSKYGVHATLVHNWKRRLLEGAVELFERSAARAQQEQTAREAEWYEQIGRLQMELEWLKKKVATWDGRAS